MKKTMLFIMITLFGLGLGGSASWAKDAKAKWDHNKWCSAPESTYYHASSKAIYVSCIVGEGDKKDGVGWISKLAVDGTPIKVKWVDGLNAPKGMRAHQGTLWVADIDQVVAIKIKTGKVLHKTTIANAKFLNDVAVDAKGRVYVSDSLGQAIYQLKNRKVSVYMKGDNLESPNGLLVANKKLYVAAWGLTTDWSTKVLGRLYAIDLKSKKITYITKKPFGNLDGLEIDKQGNFLVSDWKAGKVYRVNTAGGSTELYSGFNGSADIAYVPEASLLVVPRMNEDRLTAYKIHSGSNQ